MNVTTKEVMSKSLFLQTTIKVTATPSKGSDKIVTLTITASLLKYASVIELLITSDTPYDSNNPMEWDDHPFKYVDSNHIENNDTVADIIDDTPATRALIEELAEFEPKKLYTTTDCTHRSRIIRSLTLFWS